MSTQQRLKELRRKGLEAKLEKEEEDIKFYSIGYGGLNEVKDLTEIMDQHGVNILLDVRSKPNTRRFARKTLQAMLGAGYISRTDMGGFDHEVNQFEEWYERAAPHLEEIIDKANNGFKILIMCAEKNPDQCHRKYFVSKALELQGFKVKHLVGPAKK